MHFNSPVLYLAPSFSQDSLSSFNDFSEMS